MIKMNAIQTIRPTIASFVGAGIIATTSKFSVRGLIASSFLTISPTRPVFETGLVGAIQN
jgi:hypothetical protein